MKIKRILSIALSICMLLTIAQFPVMAATIAGTTSDGFGYIIENDEAWITDYYGDKTEIVIPSTVEGYPVTSIHDYAFYSRDSLTRVDIPDSVISIGYGAFQCCYSLTNVSLGNNVTYIQEYAFNDCSKLENIILPNDVAYIGYAAFSGCDSFTSVTIPDGVTSIGYYAFAHCDSLTSITFPKNFNGIFVDIFEGCTNLERIIVEEDNDYYSSQDGVLFNKNKTVLVAYPPAKSTSKYVVPNTVEEIGAGAFDYCTNLVELVIPKSVTQIGDCNPEFQMCSKLENFVVDANNEVYYSEDGVLFSKDKTILLKYPEGKNLTQYTIPSTVTTLAKWAFSDNVYIQSVTMNSVEKIYMGAFQGCSTLTNVTISKKLRELGEYAFNACPSLKNIVIPNSLASIGTSAFGYTGLTSVKYTGTEEEKALIDIANDNEELLLNATWTYNYGPRCEHVYSNDCDEDCDNCGTIRSVEDHIFDNTEDMVCNECGYEKVPEGLAYYKFSNGDYPYFGVDMPAEICISGYRGSATELRIPAYIDGCPVTRAIGFLNNTIYEDFTGTSTQNATVESLIIPHTVTWLRGLSDLTKLKSITVSPDNEHYSSDDGVLFNGDKTELVYYPSQKEGEIYRIPEGVTGLQGNEPFFDCANLKEIVIPSTLELDFSEGDFKSINLERITVDENNEILFTDDNGILFVRVYGQEWLIDCPPANSLTEYEIPNTVTNIADLAFAYCKNLETVRIPNTITDIPYGCFGMCENLTSVTIPSGVTEISGSAFYEVNTLTDVYYDGTEEQRSLISIGVGNDPLLNATWHYTEDACEHVYDNEDDALCNECGFARHYTYYIEDGEVTISGYNGPSVDLVIPAYIKGYPVTKLASFAFYNDTNIVHVTLPETLKRIGWFAFYGCTSLKGDVQTSTWSTRGTSTATLTIPDSVVEIGESAFGECTSLESVTIGTSVETIGDSAFSNCTALTTVNIPKSVTTIGTQVFAGCESLTEVKYEGTESDKENIVFGDDNDDLLDNWQNTVTYTPGDVNGDGVVSNKDLGVLRRFLNDWDVEIDELASDVNRDGNVNNKDLGILRRYLNDWDVELK